VPPWAAARWDPQRGPFAPQLAMIIDLSNSSRYYSSLEVPQGVAYVKVGAASAVCFGGQRGGWLEKSSGCLQAPPSHPLSFLRPLMSTTITRRQVPCVGRDASPDPLAVNQLCWEVNKALMSYPDTYFLVRSLHPSRPRTLAARGRSQKQQVDKTWSKLSDGNCTVLQAPTHPHHPETPQLHCTHGFNRTGYMIACAMMRLLAPTGMCVERAVRRFAQQRPPGIYKHHYIEDLFK
jgi:hypothetical protein